MQLMFQPLRKYADFQGRARRAEYWQYFLFQAVLVVVAVALARIVGGTESVLNVFLGVVFGGILLATIIPGWAVTVRRLHDSNRTGYWCFINLLPFVGGIVLILFTLKDGTPGTNRFGLDPKGREAGVFA